MPNMNLTESILNMPFPRDVKIRVSITGLAYCRLGTGASTISFLSHIPHHELTMTVVKRVGDSGAAYPVKHYRIAPGDPISIELNDAARWDSIKTKGPFPLNNIVNLRTLHGAELERLPSAPEPSKLTVHDCAFYTMMIYPGIYKFVESNGSVKDAREVGLVMGGNIVATKDGSAGRITWGSHAADTIFLPGTDDGTEKGQPFVYDIVFNNHCVNDAACSQERMQNGSRETDFSFYYDVLRQVDDAKRSFQLLEKSPRESGVIVDPFDDKSGNVDAACNPVIIDPPEPYG